MKLIKDNGMEKEKRRDKNKIRWNKFFIILTLILLLIICGVYFYHAGGKRSSIRDFLGSFVSGRKCRTVGNDSVHFYNMYDYDRIKLETPVLKGSFPEVDILSLQMKVRN